MHNTVPFRCDCPITSALDIIGDRWMLIIVKQMLVEGKQTFKEFTQSDEAIATNILSTKLKCLEALEVITKTQMPGNKKTNIYRLTEKGLALAPLIIELAIWSDAYVRPMHADMQKPKELTLIHQDKAGFIDALVQRYKAQSPL
ncbi:winged helix-turn-helix transcriptional regulator [Ostreibacterium oceani]|uniref:Transcriptional regulator n=1 Tax=Ostreibacterium oceani TaxID=2654998 RepID=A0A6N7EWG7_9GAMM|nr:helix-turn-helix domain-containing protein [Ostreibacterium oceani]MPV86253.1 transcriptional regulator [Ostreibacterium oceani]